MAKLYEYVINLYNNGKCEAFIREFELVAESEKQYVYKKYDRFEIQDKKDYNNRNMLIGCSFKTGSKFFGVRPHFAAWYYTKKLTKSNENKIIKLLEKTVNEDFNFIKNLNIKINFEEIKTYE